MPPKKFAKAKVIRSADGVERIAQACDRCRSKKTKCDGKRPQCSQCKAVGFECKISDKLSRRAFPRGYTESLEERIRELEAENRRLLALLKLKSEQIELLAKPNTGNDLDKTSTVKKDSNSAVLPSPKSASSPSLLSDIDGTQLSSTNLSLLNQLNTHEPHEEGCNCGCVNYPHSLHERPTSIAPSVILGALTDDDLDNDDDDEILSISSLGSATANNDSSRSSNFFDDAKRQFTNLRNNSNSNSQHLNGYYQNFNVSFEQKEAPGAAAAMAIASVKSDKNQVQNQIATLVAMSAPRTTEEILFIPSLLGKVGRCHGFNSKAAFLTAKSLALLKNHFVSKNPKLIVTEEHLTFNSCAVDFRKLSQSQSQQFFKHLRLPTRLDLDQLITFYFQEWSKVDPVVDQQEFLKAYIQLVASAEIEYIDNAMFGKERFGAIVLIIVTLALLGKRKSETRDHIATSSSFDEENPTKHSHSNSPESNELQDKEDSLTRLLNYYDILISQIVSSSLVEPCCMQSLQILTLALMYSLNVGNINESYILRGKVVSMCQQLRLHRCPSAVLSNNGSIVSKVQQSERRILFWCIYVLDVFGSLQLGVPRLLKDYEIECALPFANDDLEDNNNTNILIINNSKLSLVGKVSSVSLAVMRFAKILGNILDSIFRRGGVTVDALGRSCIILEDLLENWRKDLPKNLRFELDVNGLLKSTDVKLYNRKTLIIIVLYYHARILIYLPVLAAEVNSSRGSSAHIAIQQSTSTILTITNHISRQNFFLPTPFNSSRMRARYGLLGAKGALEYYRGGHLFQDLKTKLTNLIEDLKTEIATETPGCLSVNCIKTFDEAIQAILAPVKSGGLLSNNHSTVGKVKRKQSSNILNNGGSNLKNSVINSEYLQSDSQSISSTSVTPQPSIGVPADNGLKNRSLSPESRDDKPKGIADFNHLNPSLTSQAMTPSSTQMTPSSTMTNGTKNSPSDSGFEIDPSILSDFAADGSLGLAQLLDLSNTNLLMQQLQNGKYGASNGNVDQSSSTEFQKSYEDFAPKPDLGDVDLNSYNVNHYNANAHSKYNNNNQNGQNGQIPFDDMNKFNNTINLFFNNNDNNPIPNDLEIPSTPSIFDWQKRNNQ